MTKQEIFDKVATHLLTQNKKSYLPGYNNTSISKACAYRGEDNCKCGIGILIPDDKYDPSLESKTVINNDVLLSLEDGIDREDVEIIQFLSHLQCIHDLCPIEEWKFRLTVVAEDYGLSFASVIKDGRGPLKWI